MDTALNVFGLLVSLLGAMVGAGLLFVAALNTLFAFQGYEDRFKGGKLAALWIFGLVLLAVGLGWYDKLS